jgi:uncharacterized membrane protein
MTLLGIIIGSSWIFVGLVIGALGIPLARQKIPPNRLYGVRLQKSFQSETAWYDINRYGGKQMIYWSVPLILAGAALLFLPITPNYVGFLVPIELIFIAIPILKMIRYANRYGSNQ